jgi:hypothetical protein
MSKQPPSYGTSKSYTRVCIKCGTLKILMSYYLHVGSLKCDNVSFGHGSIDNMHISAEFVVALIETKQILPPSSKLFRH